ncbi:TIGR02221 family CRISPR-associated protein [bacterium]|nr:TIGR02221 family CRISPR-associated protein [bacterium]
MARVFISFLGAGKYQKVNYKNISFETEFIQQAIISQKDQDFFNRIRILTTPTSKQMHWKNLKIKLNDIAGDKTSIENVMLSENLLDDQWTWFETILALVNDGDEVWFDMTHGYRAFSIILSAALSFIQKSKNIDLKAVYYGAHEAEEKPIIDMVNFYRINEWADGVSQLVDTADATKLASLAQTAESKSFQSLNDPELVSALLNLTNIIKNVDVNHVQEKAERALSIIRNKCGECSGADQQLLSMIINKFAQLTVTPYEGGKYNIEYFNLQIKLIEMLIKHKFLMQAFTVMRECIASFGMLAIMEEDTRDHRVLRKIYAEKFIASVLLKFNWGNRAFTDMQPNDLHQLKRFAERFVENIDGILSKNALKKFVYKIKDIRNGFDHAWTSGNERIQDIENVARSGLETLASVIKEAHKMGLIQ